METIESRICQLYKDGRSTYEIATMLGSDWYSQKVRRLLVKCGIKLRNKSESQKIALSSSRSHHPTKGKHHSSATRSIIGKSVSESWEKITDDERSRRSNKSKANWDLMSESEREELRAMAAQAVRKAAIEGSKAEKYLLIKLRNEGWQVEFHTYKRLPTHTLQIDLFLPDVLTAIEIDGPNHWSPIWGEEHLQNTIKSDNRKNALLSINGYNVIRIKTRISKITKVYCEKLWVKLSPLLEELKVNYKRNVEDRLIVLEI